MDVTVGDWLLLFKNMKSHTKYFRNKFQMHTVKEDSLWKLDGKYIFLLNNKLRLKVYYESHEDWFYEIEPSPEELKKNNQ